MSPAIRATCSTAPASDSGDSLMRLRAPAVRPMRAAACSRVGCRSCAARCDDGNRYRGHDCTRELQVITGASAIAIDAREENLTGAMRHTRARPFHGIELGARATPSGVYSPVLAVPFRIDARNDTLRAESRCRLGEHLGTTHGRAVDAHLVRSETECERHVVRRANTSTKRERNEQSLRCSSCDVEHRLALIRSGGDVEKHDLVRTLMLIARGQIDGIADVAKLHELLAFHHTAALHVETDHHAPGEHHVTSSPTAPLVLNTPDALSPASACRSDAPSALTAASTT